jgi:RNA polymerase sigma factor (TIGR02999 family)
MRRILVEQARSKNFAKRGGGAEKISLDETAIVSAGRSAEVIAVDEALNDLESWDPRKGRIVELRFFGGLSIEETAEVLKVSPTTVQREWRSAKAWLYRAISEGDGIEA